MHKDFITIADYSVGELNWLIGRSIADKAEFREGCLVKTLVGKTLAMVFEKPSLRTRVSFATAMTQLGGSSIYLTPADIGLGTREPVQDAARVLGRMCDGIMARTFSHEIVVDLARFSPAPVINALTDHSHPCQAMADLMTIREHFQKSGRSEKDSMKLVFVGDGNNVARSLAMLCARMGLSFVLACPKGYELDGEFIDQLKGSEPQAEFDMTNDPAKALADCDVVYTDTWVSMGQEQEKSDRVKDFDGFQINSDLMKSAPDHAIVLHCLPAYRGYEITDEIMEKHAATIFEEAENRLHFQRTLLSVLIAREEMVL